MKDLKAFTIYAVTLFLVITFLNRSCERPQTTIDKDWDWVEDDYNDDGQVDEEDIEIWEDMFPKEKKEAYNNAYGKEQ